MTSAPHTPRNKRKNFLFSMAAMMLGLMTVLTIAEISVRIYNEMTQRDPLLHYDPILGWTLIPDKKTRLTTDGFEVDVKLNKQGFNDKNWNKIKSKDTYRIAFLGDSFTAGLQIDNDKTFVALVQKSLNEKQSGKNSIETMNFSVPGYTLDQEYLLYKQIVSQYNPDMIVLCIFTGNDLFEISTNFNSGTSSYKPFYKLKNDKLVLQNVPAPRPFSNQTSPNDNSLLGRVKIFLKRHSALYSFFTENLRTKHPWLYALLNQNKVSNSRFVTNQDLSWETQFLESLPPKYHEAEHVYSRVLEQMNADCKLNGTRLIALIIPIRFQVDDDNWNEFKSKKPGNNYSRDKINSFYIDQCKRLGITVKDLLPDMRKLNRVKSRDPKELYFPKDGHFNIKGHEFAHLLITDFLEQLLKQ